MVGDEVTFGGIPLCETYGLIVAHFEENPPEPKTEVVEIPFGTDIDITEAIGPIAFSNRTQTIEFLALCGGEEFRELYSRLLNLLNGVRESYTLSFDPGYTYNGRWTVASADFTDAKFGKLTVQIDTDPWKISREMEYVFSAYPAVTKTFESGKRPVRPVVTTGQDVTVIFKGISEIFPEGSHTSNNLLFTFGQNEATFQAKEFFLYFTQNRLVVKDDYISYDSDTESVVLDDEIISAFDTPTITLDDSKQLVKVTYTWSEL